MLKRCHTNVTTKPESATVTQSHLACELIQFNLVQFKMVSMCSEKPICTSPSLLEVFPLPLKWFQCLIDDGPLSSFQERSSSASSFQASLLQAIDGVMSKMVSMRLEMPICAPPRFSGVSPTAAFEKVPVFV